MSGESTCHGWFQQPKSNDSYVVGKSKVHLSCHPASIGARARRGVLGFVCMGELYVHRATDERGRVWAHIKSFLNLSRRNEILSIDCTGNAHAMRLEIELSLLRCLMSILISLWMSLRSLWERLQVFLGTYVERLVGLMSQRHSKSSARFNSGD